MKSKKGQISSLATIIAALMVIGILIATGFFVTQEFLEQEEFSDTPGVVTNETGFYMNSTSYAVDMATITGFNTFVVTNVVDTISNETLLSGNYTTNDVFGTIINATADANSTAEHYVSYTFLYGDTGYEGIENTLTAMEEIPSLLPLIILIIMIGIILAVIFNVIPGARVQGA